MQSISKRKRITTFAEYERIVKKTDERKSRTVSLLGLVGEVGDLHSMIKKLLVQHTDSSFRSELREEFGDLLWYLTSLAALNKISLQEIAATNAAKAKSLYSKGSVPRHDAGYPKDERFPRKFTVRFVEKPLTRGVQVKIFLGEVAIGDALTDNAHIADDYRYHDIFHFAYAGVLGWSPVVRALLKRKRKSDEKVDEVEDGARAAIVEEAVSIFLFNQAEQRDWYLNKAAIDISLLKTVRRLTSGLEVDGCTAKQWQNAIHQGYIAFDQLRKNKGGEVEVNLDGQLISYRRLPERQRSR